MFDNVLTKNKQKTKRNKKSNSAKKNNTIKTLANKATKALAVKGSVLARPVANAGSTMAAGIRG